jgi:hypothetical protein
MDNQTTHREILKFYQEEENRAEAAYRFATNRHAVSIVSAKRKEWDKAREILFAVDAALMLYRERTEKEAAK